jgi:hypothetical protein
MKTTVRLAMLAAIAAISAGCISPNLLKSQSAGQTGCAPDAIEVTQPQGITGGYMWNAICSGKKYLCTALSSGKSSAQVSCALATQ